MKTTRDYIAALRGMDGVSSFADIARLLHVTPETVARYKKGSTFDDDIAIRVADTLGIPRHEVYLSIQAERAANNHKSEVFDVLGYGHRCYYSMS